MHVRTAGSQSNSVREPLVPRTGQLDEWLRKEVLNEDHGSNGFNRHSRLRMNCAWLSDEWRARKTSVDSSLTTVPYFGWQRTIMVGLKRFCRCNGGK